MTPLGCDKFPSKLLLLLTGVGDYTRTDYTKTYALDSLEHDPLFEPLLFLQNRLTLPIIKQFNQLVFRGVLQEQQQWHRDFGLYSEMAPDQLSQHVTSGQIEAYQRQKKESPVDAAASLDLLSDGLVLFMAGDDGTKIDLLVKKAEGRLQKVSVTLAPGSILAIDRTQIHRGNMYKGKHRRFYFACLKKRDVFDNDSTYPVHVDDIMQEVITINA